MERCQRITLPLDILTGQYVIMFRAWLQPGPASTAGRAQGAGRVATRARSCSRRRRRSSPRRASRPRRSRRSPLAPASRRAPSTGTSTGRTTSSSRCSRNMSTVACARRSPSSRPRRRSRTWPRRRTSCSPGSSRSSVTSSSCRRSTACWPRATRACGRGTRAARRTCGGRTRRGSRRASSTRATRLRQPRTRSPPRSSAPCRAWRSRSSWTRRPSRPTCRASSTPSCTRARSPEHARLPSSIRAGMDSPAGISSANAEAIEAWNGVLFDRFVQHRDVLVNGLGAHGEQALALHPPRPGDRALDIGCGFGDTSQRIAELVGPEGSVLGVDAAERFIETAGDEAVDTPNVSFEVADVEAAVFDGGFDYAFSRFGTMFFANPVAALRNVRQALVPGGRLVMVVWRRKLENEWLHRAEQVVERFVEEDENSDEPTCGPGPFSMADADVTSQILLNAGFEDVSLRRCDLEFKFGATLDDGVNLVMALGPAGEVLRLAGEHALELRPQIEAALKEELSELEQADGVRAAASTWIVAATNP